MTTTLRLPTRTTDSQLERSLQVLDAAHNRLAAASADELISLAEICIYGTLQVADEWVAVSSRFKGLPEKSSLRAEDVMTGPVATVRHLRLLIQSLRDIKTHGKPRLPGKPQMGPDARLRVPVFPAKGLFDGLTFQGFKVESRMLPGITAESLRQCPDGVPGRWNPKNPRIALVLGAGNVSSIPTTDAFTKLFQEGRSVLLKMNPVNESLGPVFERAYAPLIDAGYLQIIYGGGDVGAAAVQHELVGEIHITGSIHSHDAIVWGARVPSATAANERTIRSFASQSRASWATSHPGSSSPESTPTSSSIFRPRTSPRRSRTIAPLTASPPKSLSPPPNGRTASGFSTRFSRCSTASLRARRIIRGARSVRSVRQPRG